MCGLSTEYIGLKLKNPIIIGSSDLTDNSDKIIKLEESGAAAVVLKSLFEEQILNEIAVLDNQPAGSNYETEAYQYIKNYVESNNVNDYLNLISDTKKNTSIPVIASINCISAKDWITFAKKIEDAGADALELNIYLIPSDIKQKSEQLEEKYIEIIEKVSACTALPLALKVSPYFSGLAHALDLFTQYGVKGLVLFNKYISPDIDINQLKITRTTSPSDYTLALRWIGILSQKIQASFAMTGGVCDGDITIKALLAGADAVQIASTLYKNGNDIISTILERLKNWMQDNKFKTINDFKGKLNQASIKNHSLYERAQFMKNIK